MNRRNFVRNLVVAGASFSILPGAGRIWKARREIQPNPDWVDAPYEFVWYHGIRPAGDWSIDHLGHVHREMERVTVKFRYDVNGCVELIKP